MNIFWAIVLILASVKLSFYAGYLWNKISNDRKVEEDNNKLDLELVALSNRECKRRHEELLRYGWAMESRGIYVFKGSKGE